MAEEYPRAYASLSRGDFLNSWVIPQCPYCGREHVHGAGGPAQDPRAMLGERETHCARGDGDKYVLVEM